VIYEVEKVDQDAKRETRTFHFALRVRRALYEATQDIRLVQKSEVLGPCCKDDADDTRQVSSKQTTVTTNSDTAYAQELTQEPDRILGHSL